MGALARWEREDCVAPPLRLPLRCVRTLSGPIPAPLRERVDAILSGRVVLLGCARSITTTPDWIGDGGAASEMGRDRNGSAGRASVKHAWELARLGPVVDLAAAWRMTGDDRFAVGAERLLNDFCELLQDRRSVLWGSGVEAALRLFALGWVCALFGDRMTSGFPLDRMGSVAARHLDRLRRFPSRYSSANNHALVEAAGLLAGSALFGPVKSQSADRALGESRLMGHLGRQIDQAGLHREAATDYHAFVSDVLVATLLMHDIANFERPLYVMANLRKMLGASLALDAVGRPRFGDGDDSQCFGFDDRPPLERAIELAQVALGVGEPVTWQGAIVADLGTIVDARRTSTQIARPVLPVDRSELARHGWLTALRTSDSSVAMRTGALGFLSVAAHAHADLLSVVVSVRGAPLVVDPGTFCYDSHPAWRRWFRSSAAHNCLVLGGVDQSEYWGPFLWGTDASAPVVAFNEGTDGGSAVAELAPTTRNPTIRRRIELSSNRLEVVDAISFPVRARRQLLGSATRRRSAQPTIADEMVHGCLRWQLHSTVRVATDHGLRLVGPAGPVAMSLPSGWTVEIEQGTDPPLDDDVGGWLSNSFGTRVPSVAVVARGLVLPETELVTSFSW